MPGWGPGRFSEVMEHSAPCSGRGQGLGRGHKNSPFQKQVVGPRPGAVLPGCGLEERWQLPESKETWEKKTTERDWQHWMEGEPRAQGEARRPGSQQCCVTLGKSLPLFGPQFLCLGGARVGTDVLLSPLNSRAAPQLRRLETRSLYLGNMHCSGA